MHVTQTDPIDYTALARDIQSWGHALGFQGVGIAGTDLGEHETRLLNWLANGHHGSMHYMEKHGTRRTHPSELVPGTLRIISVRMDYLPGSAVSAHALLQKPEIGIISRYALGRDYHKVIRSRLQKLADKISERVGPFGYRAFTDSAPVMEKAIAEKAGLGWIGKHTNLLTHDAGSWFFLGELYTDLPLPVGIPSSNHCGTCQACIDICPTQAIIAPYQLDAQRCISYLTIELRGSIPVELRPLMGNRIYGCDDCQLVCPWNKFAQPTQEKDFTPRHGLSAPELVALFAWSAEEFLIKTEGSAIRRIGYDCWLRNIAVALGNAPTDAPTVTALRARLEHPSELVREHVRWALDRHLLSL